jgi:hypothetical protein
VSQAAAPTLNPTHAEWIAGLRWEDLPEPVRQQARRCLKDIVATAAGSGRSSHRRPAIQSAWAGTRFTA